jgi:multimeric flavodoxin WrbA
MKVFAINTSPRMDNGNTARILNPFIAGMKSAGAEVDLAYAQKLKIGPCLGCLSCVLRTPGQCVQRDDMETTFLQYAFADAVVWATPVYVDGPTAQMKIIIDRLFRAAGMNPGYEIRDGHQRVKRLNNNMAPKKVVLISTCGLYEMDSFDALTHFMQAFSKDADFNLVGSLLRPHANVLLGFGLKADDVFQAANDAGRQFVTDGRIADKTAAIVSRELLPRDTYVEVFNRFIEEQTKKNAGRAETGRLQNAT